MAAKTGKLIFKCQKVDNYEDHLRLFTQKVFFQKLLTLTKTEL